VVSKTLAGKKPPKTNVLTTTDDISEHMERSDVGEVKYDPNGKFNANHGRMHWMEKPDLEIFTNINPTHWPTKSIPYLMLYLGNWTKSDPEYREYLRLRWRIMDTSRHARTREKDLKKANKGKIAVAPDAADAAGAGPDQLSLQGRPPKILKANNGKYAVAQIQQQTMAVTDPPRVAPSAAAAGEWDNHEPKKRKNPVTA
jgi:hypothetical protein